MVNQFDEINPRKHRLCVSIAKHVFIHEDFGIVFVREPVSLAAADALGLSPLILYAVIADGTYVRWLTYARADAPESVARVLKDAWELSPALRGKPDILKASRPIVDACPGLKPFLDANDIRLDATDGMDRKNSAALREAQLYAKSFGDSVGLLARMKTVEDFNREIRERHIRDARRKWRAEYREKNPRAVLTLKWLDLPPRPDAISSFGDETLTLGPWAHSWEKSLPPAPGLSFHEVRKVTWLLPDPEFTNDGDGEYDAEIYSMEMLREVVSALVSCWPAPPGTIAKYIGTSASELKWFMKGRATLDVDRLLALLGMLRVYHKGPGIWRAKGPVVLVGLSCQAAVDAYEVLSHGGDVTYSFEAIPAAGTADPKWRYLFFGSYFQGPSVIMIERESAVSRILDRKKFINYEGPRQVSGDFYKDMVSTCAEAIVRGPGANSIEMKQFQIRHEEFIELLASREIL